VLIYGDRILQCVARTHSDGVRILHEIIEDTRTRVEKFKVVLYKTLAYWSKNG